MNWKRYVAENSDGEVNRVIAQKVGVTEPSVAKWKTGVTQTPDAKQAAAFARAYGLPVVGAFIAAGFLTEEEAGIRPDSTPSLSSWSEIDLLEEVLERLKQGGEHGGDTAATNDPGLDSGPGPGNVTELGRLAAARDAGKPPRGKRQPPTADEDQPPPDDASDMEGR